jgi:hypothetical protein
MTVAIIDEANRAGSDGVAGEETRKPPGTESPYCLIAVIPPGLRNIGGPQHTAAEAIERKDQKT